MHDGAIVVGYPGVGKTTVSTDKVEFIDLESKCFYINKQRDTKWYIAYCNVAIDLASQGYTVFVSSHESVQKYLNCISPLCIQLSCCVPSLDLKEEWIEKLRLRYEESGIQADYKAYIRAKDHYDEDITQLLQNFSDVILITNMVYDLEELLGVSKKNSKES